MALGNYQNGTGNIVAYTTNANVVGYGTSFLTQLQLGAVIGNVSNTFVGYVSNINSNTSITLTANANVAISSNTNPTNFHYRPMYANVPTFTYNTTGNIWSANTASQVVIGCNTAFATQLTYGDLIYVPNVYVGNANVTYPIDPNVLLGTVEYIVSNTTLYLSSNSLANVNNLSYFNTQPIVDYFAVGPDNTPNEPNTIAGLYTFNSQLFRWTQSGLIPNVAVINNYHPPIRDSVTGILVNLPATVYVKNGNNVSNSYTLGSSLSYSGPDYVVKDFDVHQSVFGTDAKYVIDSLHNSSDIKDATVNGSSETYSDTITQLVQQTSADSAASLIGANVARVTDNQIIAQEYFAKQTPLDAIQKFPQNLTSNQDLALRKTSKGVRKLIPTGAPIAVPGLLNAVADVYSPNTTVWTPPTFSRTNVE